MKTRQELTEVLDFIAEYATYLLVFLIDYANYATWKKPYTWVLKIWRYLRMCNRPTFDKEKVISILKQK